MRFARLPPISFNSWFCYFVCFTELDWIFSFSFLLFVGKFLCKNKSDCKMPNIVVSISILFRVLALIERELKWVKIFRRKPNTKSKHQTNHLELVHVFMTCSYSQNRLPVSTFPLPQIEFNISWSIWSVGAYNFIVRSLTHSQLCGWCKLRFKLNVFVIFA